MTKKERNVDKMAVHLQTGLRERFGIPRFFSATNGKIHIANGRWLRRADKNLACEKAVLYEILGRSGKRLPCQPGNGSTVVGEEAIYELLPIRHDIAGHMATNSNIRSVHHPGAIWCWCGSSARLRNEMAEESDLPVWALPRDMIIYTSALISGFGGMDRIKAAGTVGRYLQGVAIWGRPFPVGILGDCMAMLPQDLPEQLWRLAAIMHPALVELSRNDLQTYRHFAMLGAALALHCMGEQNGEALLAFYEELQAGKVREREYFSRMTPGRLAAHLRPVDFGDEGRRLLGQGEYRHE